MQHHGAIIAHFSCGSLASKMGVLMYEHGYEK